MPVRKVLCFCTPVNTERIGGILRYAREHRWHIVLSSTDDRRFLGWSADGVLATIRDNASGEAIQKTFTKMGTPVVDLTAERPDLDLPRVICDHMAIGRLAAEHLHERGFREFAWFSTGWSNVHALRCRGFCETVDARKLTVPSARRPHGRKNDWPHFIRWIRPLLTDAPKPLGILAYDEADASRILSACGEIGLSVPEQVAVISCGDEPLLCDFQPVTITGIDANLDRQGYEAAQLLDRLMSMRAKKARTLLIPPQGVTLRASTDIFTSSDPTIQAALKFVSENLSRPIGSSETAAALGIPRHRLDRHFAATLGTSVGREIARLRLLLARRKLVETGLSVAEIARACGYCNPGYLVNLFRRAYGESPAAYRKTHVRTQVARHVPLTPKLTL